MQRRDKMQKTVCMKCGLPPEICVCNELEKRIKKNNEKEVDDFQYCFQCGCNHYPGQHKKHSMKG